jgi:GntR family transcriptional regulator, galactonate operon transcriptional repressor
MAQYHERGSHGRVVQMLGEAIVSGDYGPGETIDTEALESRFGVSRTVIRETLKVLASKGLVDSRQRRGTFVRPGREWNRLDPDVMRWRFESADSAADLFGELHEIREMIEPPSARLAAERRRAEDVEAAAEALTRMARTMQNGDVDAFVDADVAFHAALLEASHNDLVGSLSVIIELGLRSRDALVHKTLPPPRREIALHRRVLDAVVAREPQEAEEAMRDLLANAARSAARPTP